MTNNFPNQQIDPEHIIYKKLEYLMTRLSSVTRISLFASLLVIIVGIVAFAPILPQTYRISDTFHEWTKADSDASCPDRDNPVCVGDVLREFEISLSRLRDNILGLFESTLLTGTQASNLGGVARLLSIFSASVGVYIAYRKHLEQRYVVNNLISQLEGFRKFRHQPIIFLINRMLYTLATFFGSYVIISLVWAGLSQIFKGIEFDLIAAWVIIAISVIISTFLATYWASAVTTRELMLIGVGTFVIGFIVSFAVAPEMNLSTGGEQWWEGAISNAGKLQPSAALFTSALASLAFVFWMVWYDIDHIIDDAIIHSGNDKTPLIKLRHLELLHMKRKYLIIFFYVLVIIGLLSIGVVRVAYPASEYALNLFFHSVLGAFGAIGGLFFVCWHVSRLTRTTIFSVWYDRYFIAGGLVSIAAFILSYTPIMNLTTAELIIFTVSGLLIVVTIEILLLQADLPEVMPPE